MGEPEGLTSMKLVHFSDLHLDSQFAWAGREVARRRRQRLRDVLVRIGGIATEAGADALLCGGDLYEHERTSPDTGEFLRQTFERLQPMRVFLAPGNHDWLGPESIYRRVNWPGNVHVYGSDRLEAVTLADGITLWGAAHCAPANSDGFLRDFAVDRDGINLALFHGSEVSRLRYQGEGKIAHAPFDAMEIERAGIRYAFVGHFHVAVDGEHHTYPGNPEPLTFGESGDRGIVIATVAPDGTVVRERRGVAVSEMHDMTVDITGATTVQDVRDRVAAGLLGRGGAVRVTLDGELDPGTDLELRDLDDLSSRVESLVIRVGGVTVGYDYQTLAQERTVRGQFVRDVLANVDLTDDDRKRVLVMGLRALAGRSDLELV